MRRAALTLTVVTCLWGGYRLYALVLGRMTQPAAPPPVVAIETRTTPVQPPNFVKADAFLTDADWTRRAAFKVKHAEHAFLFFDRYETRGQRVTAEPFALVWHDPKGRTDVPYVFHCERARLTFEHEFQLGGSTPGRLIGLTLDGAVLITGPNGLQLIGRDCVFSEEEHQLYSDHHCKFTYRPQEERLQVVTGEADQLQVDLTPVTYAALGRDLPRVAETPERVTLRRNVKVTFQTQEQDVLQSTTIVSKGPFVYDFERRLATFQDDVQVVRPIVQPDGRELIDRLDCAWLAVQFEEEPRSPLAVFEAATEAVERPPGEFAPLGGMRFRIVRAMGDPQKRVDVSSGQSRFAGQMRDLVYDAVQRVMVLQDSIDGVQLEHDGATLQTPALRLFHDEQRELTLAEALQGGRLDYLRPPGPDRPAQTFHALWNERLTLQPDADRGETVVTLKGEARVIQPGEQGILCDQLTLWVDSTNMRRSGRREDGVATNGTPPPAAPPPDPDAERGIPLKRVLAEGSVALAGRQFQLTRTDRLEVTFEPGTLPPLRRGGFGQAMQPRPRPPQLLLTSLTEARSPGIADGRERVVAPLYQAVAWEVNAASGPLPTPSVFAAPAIEQLAQAGSSLVLGPSEDSWDVQAKQVDVLVIQDPQSGRVDVRRLVGEGKVVVLQKPPAAPRPAGAPPPEEPLSVTGDRLELDNRGDVDQALHLTGAPAHLRRAGMHIEGDELFFDRVANTAKVIGKGMMQIPVRQSTTGEALETPSQLDLHWLREMVFDGHVAHFIEGVRGRMQDSVMRCDEMHVTLNQRVDFAAERRNSREVGIQHVRCQNGVEVEVYQWQEQAISAVAKGRAAEFELQYESGDFVARGPGHLDVWQQGERGRVEVAPDAVARANQPVDSNKLPWQFTNVRFAGKLTGNLHRKNATLLDRVRVMYAPVSQPLEVFVRDQLSQETESSKGAVWLGCDELQIALHPWPDQPGDYVQVLGVGRLARVELEGRVFQANADTLSYDESTKLFTLRGLGGNKASVYTQDRPGGISMQMLQFNPARRSGSIQGSDGASGAP